MADAAFGFVNIILVSLLANFHSNPNHFVCYFILVFQFNMYSVIIYTLFSIVQKNMENSMPRLELPRFKNVKLLILQYSSLVRLNGGVRFRVCNVCSKRLPSELNEEHSTHLKLHEKQWNLYLILLSKHLQIETQKEVRSSKPTTQISDDDKDEDTSSSDSDNPLFVPNAVDCLQQSGPRPPPLTTFEHILRRKFTYDKNPVRVYREVTDWRVAEQSNVIKFNEIIDEIGDGLDGRFFNAKQLYGSNSEAVKKISRLLCEKQCYYLPGECFFNDQHSLHFKDLLKKELHDRFNPQFEDYMMKDSKNIAILQYNESHQPKVYELCKAIGITTKLEYNSEGYLDLNYDLFCEQLWDFDVPLYILEENKVFDVILGLLSSAAEKYSSSRAQISRQYLQSNPGLNPPILSVMMHGPDLQTYSGIAQHCDTKRDEHNAFLKKVVSHKNCKSMRNDHHWMYKHNEGDELLQESEDTNFTREGPASLPDQSIVYPCNHGHWHGCQCEGCQLIKQIDCNSHKKHLQFNLDNCLVKEAVSCPDHKIDHPDNVQPGDIVVQKNVLFHNEEVLKNGRNYQIDEVILAGLPLKCKCCRRITEDHFRNHLTTHSQCNICVFEAKTKTDRSFWNKVCPTCGKKFDSERLKIIHQKKHDIPRPVCEICDESFSSKFNFQRHLVENHNVFIHANNGPFEGTDEDEKYKFTCSYCQKEFKYERNVVAHIETIHFNRDVCECRICGARLVKRFYLKRHLAEQHGVLNFGLSLDREQLPKYTCSICDKEFKRRYHLSEHEKVHQVKKRYVCDLCEETFSYKSKLTRHKSTQHEDQPSLSCSVCDHKFKSLWNLNEHFKTHSDSREVFSCNLCTRQYLSRWNLKRHIVLKHNK